MGIGSNAGDPTSALIELEVGRENEFLSKDSPPRRHLLCRTADDCGNHEKGPCQIQSQRLPNAAVASIMRKVVLLRFRLSIWQW